MTNLTEFPTATSESVWAALRESDRQRKENERFLTEKLAETDRILTEKFAETDRQMQETDRRMKELQKTVGAWAYNHGTFAEEYFFNSFKNSKKYFFGEKFDDVKKHLKNFWQGLEDEYDIVLYNHTSVVLIEVKYKAHTNDIPTVLKKAKTFRMLFPNYKDFRIYLGLASMSFYPELEQECINQGIAIIKQIGDMVIVNDKHLKVF